MIYCLYGTEKILINEFINKEINKFDVNNISKYNLEDNTVYDVLSDASYMDLFSEDKAVIFECSNIFATKEIELEQLEKYLTNPNEKTHLFLIIENETLDERRKIVKLIREKYKVFEFNKLKNNDIEKYIINSFKNEGYLISTSALNRFISNIGSNTSLIYTEIDKLKLYKIEDKKIEEEDVIKVVKKEATTDVFKLVDAVLNNNKEKILLFYKDLISSGEEEIKLVILLAGEFRLLYQIKVLIGDRLSETEIVQKLKVHPYRVKLGINRATKYSENKILRAIDALYKIDYGIKTGELIKENALLNFFLGL